MWATAVRRPARLNVLLAEPSVISRPRNRSSAIASGRWTAPGWTRSPQISSVITSRSWRCATSATAATSSSSNTRPVGLCGLQNRISRVVSSIAAASRSGSIRQPSAIERHVDAATPAVGDRVEERVVDRREHDDAVAGLGRVPQGDFEGMQRTRERSDPLDVRTPSVVSVLPVRVVLGEVAGERSVAEVAAVEMAPQRLEHRRAAGRNPCRPPMPARRSGPYLVHLTPTLERHRASSTVNRPSASITRAR